MRAEKLTCASESGRNCPARNRVHSGAYTLESQERSQQHLALPLGYGGVLTCMSAGTATYCKLLTGRPGGPQREIRGPTEPAAMLVTSGASNRPRQQTSSGIETETTR